MACMDQSTVKSYEILQLKTLRLEISGRTYVSNYLEEGRQIVFECDDIRYNKNIKVLCV